MNSARLWTAPRLHEGIESDSVIRARTLRRLRLGAQVLREQFKRLFDQPGAGVFIGRGLAQQGGLQLSGAGAVGTHVLKFEAQVDGGKMVARAQPGGVAGLPRGWLPQARAASQCPLCLAEPDTQPGPQRRSGCLHPNRSKTAQRPLPTGSNAIAIGIADVEPGPPANPPGRPIFRL